MGLLYHRKKTEQLRTLTEKEIQEKLYGRFRLSGHEDLNAPPVSLKNQASVATIEKPQEKASDLFSALVLTPKSNFSHKKSDLEFEDQEKEIKEIKKTSPELMPDSNASAVKFQSKPRIFSKPASRPLPAAPQGNFFLPVMNFLKSAGSWIGGGLAAGMVWVLRLAAAILQTIFDFLKKGQNRYWVGAILFLSILLGGIHHLNVNREKAMKTSRPRPVQSAVQARSAGRIVPAPDTASAAANQTNAPALSLPESPAGGPESENTSETTTASVSEAGTEGSFVIQVVTYANQTDAAGLLKRLRQEGFTGLVKQSTRSTGKVYYTVFVGRFKAYREAQETLAQFQKEEIAKPFQDAFIRTLR